MAQPPLLIQEGNSDSRFACMNEDAMVHNIRKNVQSRVGAGF
jgi:hypothetical protein